MSDNPCPRCGRPIQDTANLCAGCGDELREALRKIADRWPDLERALTQRDEGESARSHSKRGMKPSGTTLNEAAVEARRACTDAVWFALQVIRDDLDTLGRPFTPPRVGRSQDSTPDLARWLAAWQIPHITHVTSQESAEEILDDVLTAEAATFRVVEVGRRRKVPTGLPCEQHGTSDLGERVPCLGVMEATLTEQMPDLVCSVDAEHRIPPDVWSRQYWKRAHVVSESGARALAERMRA